jgi:hypothetical protein
MSRIVIAWLCAVGIVAAGCSSGGGQPATAPSPSRVAVGQADNGRQITVPVHSTVVVRLTSTYWRFAGTDGPTTLRRVRVETHPGSGGVPGAGRGTMVAVYRAVSGGKAVVTATRTSCGEALRCAPAQSRFRLAVVVR